MFDTKVARCNRASDENTICILCFHTGLTYILLCTGHCIRSFVTFRGAERLKHGVSGAVHLARVHATPESVPVAKLLDRVTE